MHRHTILFGCAFLALASAPMLTHAQSDGDFLLYEKMRALTEQELTLTRVDDDVVTYLTHLMDQEKMIPEGKTVADMRDIVKAALESKIGDFCEMYEATFNGCPQAYQTLRDWATDILETRSLTHDLLAIATGYETGVTGSPGEVFSVSERLLSIRHIWASRDDAILAPEVSAAVRAMPRPEAMTDSMFDELSQALQAAGTDAVWRYRYGVSRFLGAGSCRDGGGDSELHAVTVQRWCAVEEKLKNLLETLPKNADEFSPPLQRGEIVLFPLRLLSAPPHAEVWMMAENKDGAVRREVGLGFSLMLDPPLPDILRRENAAPCDRTVIGDSYCTVAERYGILPGGLYAAAPKEPGEEDGLCHLPFGRDGYLCRPMRHDQCNAEIPKKDPSSIVLTECKPSQATQPVSLTDSGPDTCRTGWWRSPTAELMNALQGSPLPPQECGLCRVSLHCAEDCGGSVAGQKGQDGVVPICIQDSVAGALLDFHLLHALANAQQSCGLAPGSDLFDTAERCCAHETEAYGISCRMLAEEGILERIDLSSEECSSALANESCRDFGQKACSSLEVTDIHGKIKKTIAGLEEAQGNNPASCADITTGGPAALAKLDGRLLSMIENLNGVCTPGCETKYENTIGGNLCYVGQCIEQSVEEARILPGRMATTVQDESFPWDACASESPRSGGLTALPAITPPLPPPYNPRLLIESLDLALCQLSGLPASTPPILCMFDPLRRFGSPAESYLSTAVSAEKQEAENADPQAVLEQMAQSIATRIGTDLLVRYLRWAGGAFSQTMRAGNQIIREMEQVTFPLTSCPRNASLQPDFCGTNPP